MDNEQASQADLPNAIAYFNRGLSHQAEGNLDQAIADYTQAIQLEPKVVEYYSARGYAYLDQGDLDLAIADFNRAIETAPGYAAAYRNRAGAYVKTGNLAGAIDDYTRASELNPGTEITLSIAARSTRSGATWTRPLKTIVALSKWVRWTSGQTTSLFLATPTSGVATPTTLRETWTRQSKTTPGPFKRRQTRRMSTTIAAWPTNDRAIVRGQSPTSKPTFDWRRTRPTCTKSGSGLSVSRATSRWEGSS